MFLQVLVKWRRLVCYLKIYKYFFFVSVCGRGWSLHLVIFSDIFCCFILIFWLIIIFLFVVIRKGEKTINFLLLCCWRGKCTNSIARNTLKHSDKFTKKFRFSIISKKQSVFHTFSKDFFRFSLSFEFWTGKNRHKNLNRSDTREMFLISTKLTTDFDFQTTNFSIIQRKKSATVSLRLVQVIATISLK